MGTRNSGYDRASQNWYQEPPQCAQVLFEMKALTIPSSKNAKRRLAQPCRLFLGAVHGDEPRYRDWAQRRGAIRADRDASPLGRILAGERIVHFADVPGGEGYLTTSGFRDMV